VGSRYGGYHVYRLGLRPPDKAFIASEGRSSSNVESHLGRQEKNDRVDAQKISDLLRCNYFPECHVASQEIRDRRRVMRYRNLLVRQSVQMKNRVGCMLMETGISYNKQKLHQRRHFNQLLKDRANELPSSMSPITGIP
jgi:hypothetical protein